jgi:predicted NBD/HSP70 family sugar kinase
VAGIHIGRDLVRTAIADLSGEEVARRDERARARSADSLIEQVADLAHGLAADAGIKWRQVTVATVGSPGVLNAGGSRVALAHNLPGWGRPGLVESLTAALGTGVRFENDVNLATVGEQWRGLGKGVDDFVYLHAGTGVGMGLVLNGSLYRGSTGAAGEVGYLPLAAADPHDPTTVRRGALEEAVGASGLRALASSMGMKPPLTPTRIFEAARRGDPKAARVVEVVAERLALAIAAIVPVVDPELVILGGSIASNGDLLLEPVERELARLSPFRTRVEVSPLGGEAEVTGALAMALEAAQERLFDRGGGLRA